jgi:hypothetical protein
VTPSQLRGRLAVLAVLAVPVAVLGFGASYSGVSGMFEPWGWAPAVPLIVDLTILVLTLSLLFGAEAGHRWAPTRPVLYLLIGTTVYLNAASAKPPPAAVGRGISEWLTAERVGHAAAPAVYAVLLELGASWVRHLRDLAEPAREGVPAGVWATRPLHAWSLQRLMWATGERCYAAAAERHLRHRLAAAELRGAPQERLARIRLRHYAVLPSAAALAAGDSPGALGHAPGERPAGPGAAAPEERPHAPGERLGSAARRLPASAPGGADWQAAGVPERPGTPTGGARPGGAGTAAALAAGDGPDASPGPEPAPRERRTAPGERRPAPGERPGGAPQEQAGTAGQAGAGRLRGAGLPSGVGSARELSDEQLAGLWRAWASEAERVSTRQGALHFGMNQERAARVRALAEDAPPRLRAVDGAAGE